MWTGCRDTDSSLLAAVCWGTYLTHCTEVAVATAWEDSENLCNGGHTTFVLKARTALLNPRSLSSRHICPQKAGLRHDFKNDLRCILLFRTRALGFVCGNPDSHIIGNPFATIKGATVPRVEPVGLQSSRSPLGPHIWTTGELLKMWRPGSQAQRFRFNWSWMRPGHQDYWKLLKWFLNLQLRPRTTGRTVFP